LDITRGAPEEQQIVITSIFKTKGLQFDYVIIPNCVEGFLPCHYNTENLIFDKARKVREPEPSEVIENERRLFYVALTRAKKMVFIGIDGQTSQNNSLTGTASRFLEEIEFGPTAAIMEAMQQLAAGNRQAQTTLLEAIEQYGGYKKVTANLLAGYLKDLGDTPLLGQIAGIVATKSEVPFAYKSAYPTRKKSTPKLDQAWDKARY
jgi:ATP-dependent exoDNAse (exonuclease V) beta subunit